MKFVLIFSVILIWLVKTSYAAYDPLNECREITSTSYEDTRQYYALDGTAVNDYTDCYYYDGFVGSWGIIPWDASKGTVQWHSTGNWQGSYCGYTFYRATAWGDQKTCDDGSSLNLTDCSCSVICPTGYHLAPGSDTDCIADDNCQQVLNDKIASCNATFGIGNWEGSITCSYNENTGDSVLVLNPDCHAVDSNETNPGDDSNETNPGDDSNETSPCPPDPCPDILADLRSNCSDSDNYACTYNDVSCSYNLTGGCVDSNDENNTDSGDVNMTDTSDILQELEDFHDTVENIASDLNDSFNQTNENLKNIDDSLSDINNSLNKLGIGTKIIDPCKSWDRNSHFVESSPGYQIVTHPDGTDHYGHCECDECFINDNVNWSERCIPDPFCTNNPDQKTDGEKALDDINKTANRIADAFDGLRDDLKDINGSIAKSGGDINSTLGRFAGQNHSDLSDINNTLRRGFFDLNQTILGLDINNTGIIDTLNQDANISDEVVNAQGEIDAFIENVKSDLQQLRDSFDNMLNIFSTPFDYSMNTGCSPVFTATVFHTAITIDLCPAFSTFAPIVALFVQFFMLYFTLRIFWAAIKLSLQAHKQ